MNAKTRAICQAHVHTVCATGCPLRKACAPKFLDSKEKFNERINQAAAAFENSQSFIISKEGLFYPVCDVCGDHYVPWLHHDCP